MSANGSMTITWTALSLDAAAALLGEIIIVFTAAVRPGGEEPDGAVPVTLISF